MALSKPSIHVSYESSEIWVGKSAIYVSTISGLGIMTICGRKYHLTWRKGFKRKVPLYQVLKWKKCIKHLKECIIPRQKEWKGYFIYFCGFCLFFHGNHEGLKGYLLIYWLSISSLIQHVLTIYCTMCTEPLSS